LIASNLSAKLYAQDSLKTGQSLWQYYIAPDTSQKFRVKVIPILTLSPETSLGFGLSAFVNWDFENSSPGTSSSKGRSTFIYTLNNQFSWITYYDIFTNNNDFVFIGSISYSRFPQFYYGVGNETFENDREKYDYQRVYLNLRSRYRAYRKLYIGLAYYYNTLYNVDWEAGNNSKYWNNPNLLGTNGYLVSGLGPELSFDSRDNVESPLRGNYLNFAYLNYGKWIGSEYKYQGIVVNLSKFFPISVKRYWVIGLNFHGEFAWGDVPFDRIPGLGGYRIMRGYYNGRYRDNNYMAFQAEWRMRIWKFIGAVAWVGTGQVGFHISDYTWAGLKPNFGIGLRFMMDKASKTNIRIDQGFGENTNGTYFSAGEAF
jgi:hypothetical protein